MNDADCITFLQWALPRMGLRWAGYRKVRRTVCKRLRRRLCALDLPDLAAYRARLEADAEEWQVLAPLCRIPISRFWRDRGVYEALQVTVLPTIAARAVAESRSLLRAWSAGCASGEEPYSLRLLWDLTLQAAFPSCRLEILASDVEPVMLKRAKNRCYSAGSLKDLPDDVISQGFDKSDDKNYLKPLFQKNVSFIEADIREGTPAGPFDLVLCRNLAFTYFASGLQEAVLQGIEAVLRPGGALVLGKHERLPETGGTFQQLEASQPIYWKVSGVSSGPVGSRP